MKTLQAMLAILFLCVFLLADQNTIFAQEGVDQLTLYLPLTFNRYDRDFDLGAPIVVDLSPTPLADPYLIIDTSGRPHVLWDAMSNAAGYYIFHSYLTGDGWSEPSPISLTLGRSQLLHPPVVGKNNQIYFVWFNTLNPGGPYRILYAEWDGTAWGPEFEVLADGKSMYIDGMVRVDAEGRPHLAFINSDGLWQSNIYYQQWTGSGFSSRQEIQKPANYSSIWLDQTGGVSFWGDDYWNNQVMYSYWRNGQFQVMNMPVNGKLDYRKQYLDGKGNLHLLKIGSVPVPGGNVTGVTHQCLLSDFSWSGNEVLSGQDPAANFILAFDDRLEQVLGWNQRNEQSVALHLWNGCLIEKERVISLPDLPEGKQWAELVSVARNQTAGKTCVLSREKYSSTRHWMVCSK